MFEIEDYDRETTWVVVMRYLHQKGRGILIKSGLDECMAKHYASRCHCAEWVVEAMPTNQYMGT